MAKIPRKHQKIFAASAANNGQFGSAQAGTKVVSTDLDVLQALSAFDTGWLSATLSSLQLPPLEEAQALEYIATTQLSYLFQEGIAEYDATTTYWTKSIVKKAGTYQIYGSKTDSNTGNALTDSANWGLLQDLSNPVGTTNPIIWCGTATGTANALVLTPTSALVAYVAGNPIAFLGGASANTAGGVTVNVSGLGAIALKKTGTTALAVNDILPGKAYFAIYDGTNYQLLNPPVWSQAADIASSATLVLDDIGGDIVNITGTTAITAVTLRQGRLKIMKFSSAVTLTNGSSLIVQGNANYTTAANDMVRAVGYAGGIVQLTIFKADGTAVVASTTPTYGANSAVANNTTGTAAAVGVGLSPSNLLGRGSTGNVAPITLDSTLQMVGTVLGLASGAGSLRGIQYFNSSATYTSTSGSNRSLVFAQGGGGAGGVALGSTDGGNTTISTLIANGGQHANGNISGGAGGTSSGGDINLTGQSGGTGGSSTSSSGIGLGGIGGMARLFGAVSIEALGSSVSSSSPLPANCGSGGAGSGIWASSGQANGGGGAGGLGMKVFNSAALTGSTVTIGAGGTSSSGGYNGSAGWVMVLDFA